MTALAGPFLIACTILGLGGIAKLAAPSPARRALRAVGLTVPLVAVRGLGLTELALASAAVLKGGQILPISVGMAYVAFAAFVVLMLRVGEGTSCGCFGSSSTPPSTLHVVVNVIAAAAAFASTGTDGLLATLDGQAGAGLPLLFLVAVGSYALYLVLTLLPTVLAPPAPHVAPFTLVDRGDGPS